MRKYSSHIVIYSQIYTKPVLLRRDQPILQVSTKDSWKKMSYAVTPF